MLFSTFIFLSGGAALVTAASRGGAKGAVKRAYDGTDTSGGGCEVDNLAGLILGDLQAAIPFCVQYGVKVITETVTSTSTRTKVRTRTTTVAPGNERHKARAAEITPAPGVLGRRDEAVNALVHQLEKCPGSAVSIACKGDGNQRVITTTTTVLERTTVTSTKTVTVTGTTFRIYSEFSANRKRSAHGYGDLAPKMYLRQYEPEPNAVYLTADVSTAIVFNWENLNPEFLGALPYYSTNTTWPEYNDVTLYSVRTTSGVPWLGYVSWVCFVTAQQITDFPGPDVWTIIQWQIDWVTQSLTHVNPATMSLSLFYCFEAGINEYSLLLLEYLEQICEYGGVPALLKIEFVG